ncbi:MAG: hypothetical protein K6E13_11510 [Lachnospiraceae bacterium]|nr:hypothetical protein [Lachnospiraceae bacterium]
MMKKLKTLLVVLLMLVSFLTFGAENTKAEVYVYKNVTIWKSANLEKMHIPVKNCRIDVISCEFDNGYDITNINSSSKKLRAWKAHDVNTTLDEHMVWIGVLAKKSGEYKVTYDVVDKDGSVVNSHEISVLADEKKPYSYIKVNGKKAKCDFKSKNLSIPTGIFKNKKVKPSIKVDVKMNKGYELKGIYIRKGFASEFEKIKKGKKYKIKDTNVELKIEYKDLYTDKTFSSTGYVYM